ncbi:hypothetical protein H9P43_001167 [Blastocladiella emersonii ATCC 22665]|nr:hypothetical protein H9P43_001167 [Blastocladiella emersonii ATCC 22665]
MDHLQINWMQIRDVSSGKVLWKGSNWTGAFKGDMSVTLPKAMLRCPAVAREINFSSLRAEPISHLRLVQNIYFNDVLVETWKFEFGFVIPMSQNSWETLVEADDEEGTLQDDEIESARVRIETTFFDEDTVLNVSHVNISYE